MSSTSCCFLLASTNGTFLHATERLGPQGERVQWAYICRLMAYLLQISGCECPKLELQGLLVMAIQASDLVGIAVLFEPSPGFLLTRLQLLHFIAHQTTAVNPHHQATASNSYRDMAERRATPRQHMSESSQLQLNQFDPQRQLLCVLGSMQLVLQYPAILHVNLAALHSSQGLVSFMQSSSVCQSKAQLSAELQQGMLAACQLLSHRTTTQDSQPDLLKQLVKSGVWGAYTTAAVRVHNLLCAVVVLDVSGETLFLLAICKSKVVDKPDALPQVGRPIQVLLGQGAIPRHIRGCLQAISSTIQDQLSLCVHKT